MWTFHVINIHFSIKVKVTIKTFTIESLMSVRASPWSLYFQCSFSFYRFNKNVDGFFLSLIICPICQPLFKKDLILYLNHKSKKVRKKERKKERLHVKCPLQTYIKLLIIIYKKLHHYYKILTFRIEKKNVGNISECFKIKTNRP